VAYLYWLFFWREAKKGTVRITCERLHPTAQLRLMHTEIERALRIRDARLLDQPHRLKLELPCKLPSLHDTPPVPSKHLTRCLRNRVQASLASCQTLQGPLEQSLVRTYTHHFPREPRREHLEEYERSRALTPWATSFVD
jgi:hypothetical protein